MMLTDVIAAELADAVLVMAGSLGCSVAVAVVDEYGALLCARRSHPSATTVNLAVAKAYTSVVTKQRTVDLEQWQHASPVLVAQLGGLGPYPLIVDFGGCPVIDSYTSGDEAVIGGMGVSGARGEEDQRLCELALRQAGFGVTPDRSDDQA